MSPVEAEHGLNRRGSHSLSAERKRCTGQENRAYRSQPACPELARRPWDGGVEWVAADAVHYLQTLPCRKYSSATVM